MGVDASCFTKTEDQSDGTITLRMVFFLTLDNMLPEQASQVKANPENFKRTVVDEIARRIDAMPIKA
ncbi:MAG: hypothetical protein IJJ33_19620 [Victivallales bacterium]|nr:hypothetical protein [Victivallales bacterium]